MCDRNLSPLFSYASAQLFPFNSSITAMVSNYSFIHFLLFRSIFFALLLFAFSSCVKCIYGDAISEMRSQNTFVCAMTMMRAVAQYKRAKISSIFILFALCNFLWKREVHFLHLLIIANLFDLLFVRCARKRFDHAYYMQKGE